MVPPPLLAAMVAATPIFDHHGGTFETVSLRQSLALDPATGIASSTITLELTALVAGPQRFAIVLDEGLAVEAVTSPGHTVAFASRHVPPKKVTTIELDPPLAAGEGSTIELRFAGTLACAPGARPHCVAGGELQHFLRGSVLPAIEDAGAIDVVVSPPRDVTVDVPSGVEVLLPGDRVEDDDDGLRHRVRATWPAASGEPGLVMVTGRLDRRAIAGATPPAALYTVRGDTAWVDEIAGWAERILPFLTAHAGAAPGPSAVSLVKLPAAYPFRGTAGYGLVLLHEDYARPGELFFERTWAHELSHMWWGAAVEPADITRSHLLTEGLATLAEHDYTASSLTGWERDFHLWGSYADYRLLLRYYEPVPPIAVADTSEVPRTPVHLSMWRYMKTAATLDHLRLGVGEETFAAALHRYARDCRGGWCTAADFQAALEADAGRDLDRVFAQWVYGTTYPEVTIGFTQSRAATGWSVEVSAGGLGDVELPLELILEHDDGSRTRARNVFTTDASTVTVETAQPVRRVRPNPRHDAIVWSRSAVEADATMDAEIDGFDLAHCAFFLGADAHPVVTVNPSTGAFTYTVTDIDARCDADGDGIIAEDDLTAILDRFGTVREAP